MGPGRRYTRPVRERLGLIVLMLLVGACDVFSLREPEDPITDSGTFVQPDTPDQVIANLEAAIAELNVANYARSMADDLTFHPTTSAEQRDAIWSGWGRAQEQSWFTQLVAAASQGGEHVLELTDETMTVLTEDRYSLEARYVLTVQHSRVEVPSVVQGRLVWIITQGADAQWRLQEWTDRELGTAPSWSDLKAGFSQ